MNKKKLIIIAMVFILLILIGGSTYAYWTWHFTNEYKTNVTFTVTSNFSCSADGGGNITKNDVELIPTFCTNDPYVIRRTITTNVVNNSSDPVYLDLWLKVNELGTELSNSQNFRYALTDSATSCTSGNVLASGNFNGTRINDKIDLLIDDTYNNTANKTYYLYIWLDTPEDNRATMDQNFNLELGGSCGVEMDGGNGTKHYYGTYRDTILNGSDPEYLDGLIPVTLNSSGSTVTVANTNQSWYNYNNKEWANAVLVNEDTHTRSYYLNNPGTEIPESDILAYYVWIPRYSYKVWAYSGSDPAGSPQEIDIKFVSPLVKEIASQIGEYYTHPAFTFGTKELSGIWVGKFETSHTTLSSSTTDNNLGCSSSSCTTYSGLRILPNVVSLRYNNVSNFFYASRAMETSGNDFGINPSTTDSHMMKNSEWGAVAYLSHSKYGINDEIRINNTYNIVYNGSTRTFLTGCGAGRPNEASEAACDIQYRTVSTGSYPQSTTGNVTGIFDMSGGANEYVMGTYNNSNSYSNTSSGFTSSNPLPDAKYYDNYANPPFDGTNSTNFTRCTLATCGGHALNETKNWHSDYAYFVYSSGPWFHRGGYYGYGSVAGTFFAYCSDGNYWNLGSFRLVLLEE